MNQIDVGVEQIHQASMRVLAEKGQVFHLPEAVEIAKKNGLKVDGATVFFTERQLMDLITRAPARFTMTGATEKQSVVVGDNHTRHIPGGASQFFMEADGFQRDAEMRDYVVLTKLFHAAAEIDIMAGMVVQPSDVKPEDTLGHVLYQLLRLTDKPLQILAGDARTNRIIFNMIKIARGGEGALNSPRVMVVANPLSPLRMDQSACFFLMDFARNGQPVCVAPCAMAGSTAPMTLAGAFVQTNAETLAGLALAQMVNPGVPVIYGFLTTMSDLKTGSIATGAPEQALSAIWGARLAKFYNLPCRTGGGGLTDSDCVGAQSGYESMMNLMAAALAGSHVSFQSAGVLGAFNTMNLEKAVSDLEAIGMVNRIRAGVAFSDETLAEKAKPGK